METIKINEARLKIRSESVKRIFVNNKVWGLVKLTKKQADTFLLNVPVKEVWYKQNETEITMEVKQ